MEPRDDSPEARQIVAMFDAPAFVRRARHVEFLWEAILERCQRQSEAWLTIPRLRLGRLFALAGEWSALTPYVAHAPDTDLLAGLYTLWRPVLRLRVERTSSPRILRHAIDELFASFARFNRRWEGYIAAIDLEPLNNARAAYNKFYVLEKECALRSPQLARDRFVPLVPATAAELFRRFPLLPVPVERS